MPWREPGRRAFLDPCVPAARGGAGDRSVTAQGSAGPRSGLRAGGRERAFLPALLPVSPRSLPVSPGSPPVGGAVPCPGDGRCVSAGSGSPLPALRGGRRLSGRPKRWGGCGGAASWGWASYLYFFSLLFSWQLIREEERLQKGS